MKVVVKDYSQPKIAQKPLSDSEIIPYVVADLKMMDRCATEVEIAAAAGVDEERFNKEEKRIPLHEIRRINGNYNILIAIAGGDTLKEAQRAVLMMLTL